MRRGFVRTLALGAFAAATARGGLAADEFPAAHAFQTVKVAEGIYAFVFPESKTGVVSGNSVAVIGEESVLVVDAGRYPTMARREAAEIRKLTSKPVRYLVHTHWHADHVLAAQEFRDAFPGLVTMATAFTKQTVARMAPRDQKETAAQGPAMLQQIRERLDSGKKRDGTPLTAADREQLETQLRDYGLYISEMALARVTLPDVAFEQGLEIELGKRPVRVQFLGRGNTAGDAIVVVPDARVVATGDLLVLPTPYGHGCYPGDWIQTLGKLMAIDAAAIVPGHGPVLHDWSYAGKLVRLLEALRAEVGEQVRAGATLEQTREKVTLERFVPEFAGDDPARIYAFRAFFVPPAVDRAYQEAKGRFAPEGS
jgi:glyoxylase-like metal-dependent hydrolase (beta-lactamase superfamily II)